MQENPSGTHVSSSEPTVLFADIVGSTALYARLQDHQAKALVDELFGQLQPVVEAHGGRVVKSIGDALMCVFDSAEGAARGACAMQNHAVRRNFGAREKLSLKIGFHTGPAIVAGGDVFGDTVNTASRVASQSPADRVLTTKSSALRLPQRLLPDVRPWKTVAVKGKEEGLELVEIVWRVSGMETAMVDSVAATTANFRRIHLKCGSRGMSLERGQGTIKFGRHELNDLVVRDPTVRISNSHGEVSFRGGTPVVTDTSRNGIYVEFSDGRVIRVKGELMLFSSGRMALGRLPSDPEAIFLNFDME